MSYLDHNATTRPIPAVVEAMTDCLVEGWANPSSTHRDGLASRHRVELAREQVARLVGCRPRDLLLCSGGTESANLAIRGVLHGRKGAGLATSRLEHSAVRDTAERLAERGTPVHWLTHHPNGLVDLDALESLLVARGDEIALVSVMWVNNETGIIQPIAEIGRLCREHGVRFHTDAVQAAGRMPIDLASLEVDLASVAAHKFHGPKGAGALFIGRGVRLDPQITGGGQERDRRGGTSNVPAIVGMGVAAEAAKDWLDSLDSAAPFAALESRRDRFESTIRERLSDVVEVATNGGDAPRLWTTANLGFTRLAAEGMLIAMSERGVMASAGAACSSGSLEPSPILMAMGVPETVAHGSIRFSFARDTTDAEIDEAIPIVAEVVRAIAR